MIFYIHDNPIACQRARKGKYGFYNPQKKQKEEVIAEVFNQITKGFCYFDKVSVKFRFFMKMPKSWSKKKKSEMIGLPHIKKPDLSNLIKFYEDALNKIMWKDDSNIWEISSKKIYSLNPHTEIELNHIEIL